MEKNDVVNTINYLRKYRTKTDRIEAKTANGGFPKKCYDTFSSFSNKYGGMIIFGINEENNFSTEGVYDVKDLQNQISHLCTDSMEPAIRPDILPLEFEGKNIVAVSINEISQNRKPCYYKPKGIKGGSYTRVGDKDDNMTDYELYALQSYKEHIFEDTRPTKRATVADLNSEQLNLYIEKVKNSKPNFSKNDFAKCLKLCGITDSNDQTVYPTLAGTMIFGEYPQSFYPQLFVACVVVPGNKLGDVGTMGERFIDNKRIEGTIEEMLNPGALYGTNKIEKLGTDTTMESRNPTLVRILEDKGSVIENRHSGIPTMKREMKKYGLPEPEFYEERDSFKVIFRNSENRLDQQVSEQVSEQVLKYRKLVVEYCSSPKSAKEIREFLNIKSRNYVNDNILKPLINASLIEYTNKKHINASNQKYKTIQK